MKIWFLYRLQQKCKQQIYLESLNVKLIAQLIFIVLQIQENLLFPFFNWRNPEKNHSRMFAQLLLQHVQCMLSQLSTSQRVGTFLLCARVCVWKNARSTFFHCISKNDSSYRQAGRQASTLYNLPTSSSCYYIRRATTKLYTYYCQRGRYTPTADNNSNNNNNTFFVFQQFQRYKKSS